MRIERRRGHVNKQHAVEAAHFDLFGEEKYFWEIAASLHGPKCRTGEALREQILRRYSVEISTKTANLWLNRAQQELSKATSASAA